MLVSAHGVVQSSAVGENNMIETPDGIACFGGVDANRDDIPGLRTEVLLQATGIMAAGLPVSPT
jgi:hypothetical protein